MALGSVALKSTSIFIRGIELLASLAVLGIFSYYLVYLSHHDGHPTYIWVRAVEGLSGASALYTLIAFFLTCCLGGVMFFAFIGILLDVLFIGAWIAVAVLTRGGGTTNCSALGRSGSFGFYAGSSAINFGNDAKRICILEKASFGIAIGGAVLFLISALLQLAMGRHHQTEKRRSYNSNNGPKALPGKRKFWQRKPRRGTRDVETNGAAYRPSHGTGFTGNTATDGVTDEVYTNKYGQPVGNEAPYGRVA